MAAAALGVGISDAPHAQLASPTPSPDAILAEFEKAALNGDANAQATLGTLYFDGQGVVQDHPKAMKWLQMAAAQNRPDALLRLGMAYYYPTGSIDLNDPPQDSLRSGKYFDAAYQVAQPLADSGDAIGLYVVGRIVYQNWKSTDMPFSRASDMVRQSAEKGYAPAQCYYANIVRQKQPNDAKLWFDKAMAQGASCGMVGLGVVYEMEHRPDLAQDWLTRAAMLGSLEASRRLYTNYHVTVGDPKVDYMAGGRLNPNGDLGLPGRQPGAAITRDTTFQAVAGILAFSALAVIILPKPDSATMAANAQRAEEDSRRFHCRLVNPDAYLRFLAACDR